MSGRSVVRRFAAGVFAFATLASLPALAGSVDWAQFRYSLEKDGVNPHEKTLGAKNVAKLTKLWAAKTKGDIYSSAAVVGGTAYVGAYDGKVYAFDAASGTPVWTAATKGPIMSSPAVVNGVLYIGSDDDNVYAFDATTGAKIWSFPTG